MDLVKRSRDDSEMEDSTPDDSKRPRFVQPAVVASSSNGDEILGIQGLVQQYIQTLVKLTSGAPYINPQVQFWQSGRTMETIRIEVNPSIRHDEYFTDYQRCIYIPSFKGNYGITNLRIEGPSGDRIAKVILKYGEQSIDVITNTLVYGFAPKNYNGIESNGSLKFWATSYGRALPLCIVDQCQMSVCINFREWEFLNREYWGPATLVYDVVELSYVLNKDTKDIIINNVKKFSFNRGLAGLSTKTTLLLDKYFFAHTFGLQVVVNDAKINLIYLELTDYKIPLIEDSLGHWYIDFQKLPEYGNLNQFTLYNINTIHFGRLCNTKLVIDHEPIRQNAHICIMAQEANTIRLVDRNIGLGFHRANV